MTDVFDAHQQWFDNNRGFIVGGKVYYGIPNTDPTILANQIDVFADRNLTVPLPNPQTIGADGRVENKPWIGLRYSIQVDDQFDVTQYSSPDQGETPATTIIPLKNVQGTNDLTAEAIPTISGYIDKQQYTLTIVIENTGAMTLDIDLQGPFPIKDKGNDILPGQFPVDQIITVAFNSIGPIFDLIGGTNLSSPPPIGDGTPNTVASTEFTGPLGTSIQNPVRGTTFQALLGPVINEISTDGTLGDDSDEAVPTEKAVKEAIETLSPLANQLLHVQDQRSTFLSGGTFTAGAERKRTLNTILTNEIIGAILSGNSILLPAGNYYAEISAPGHQVGSHRAKLVNISLAIDLLIGTSEQNSTSFGIQTRSFISGRFMILTTNTIEIQHRCSTTRSSDGFGESCGFGPHEVYTDVKIWKVG